MQAIDILHLVTARADYDKHPRKAQAFWMATFELKNEEYKTWDALIALGLQDAAECAWQRRTAAADLLTILTTCA